MKPLDLKAKRLIRYRNRMYGLLAAEKTRTGRTILTIQKINKAGNYIHSPIRVYGELFTSKRFERISP